MYLLRAATASQEIVVGPFIDDTDFKTVETALSIANTDVKLVKAGATSTVNKNSGGGTHIASGNYSLTFDATDTDTVGTGRGFIAMSGALQVWFDFTVLPAKVYDSLIAGTDNIETDVVQLLGTAWLTPGTAGTPDVNVKLWNGLATVALPLTPTTAGRTLDVSATGEAGIDWANVGSPTTANALSNTTVALTAAAETSLVAAVWAYTIEASRSAVKLMKLFSSALLGKTASFVNGGTGTGTIRDVADTKDRISATFDANGNRTAVTLDDT